MRSARLYEVRSSDGVDDYPPGESNRRVIVGTDGEIWAVSRLT